MKTKGYLIYKTSLPNGTYPYSPCNKWHEKLRILLACLLFRSIKKTDVATIETKAGAMADTFYSNNLDFFNPATDSFKLNK